MLILTAVQILREYRTREQRCVKETREQNLCGGSHCGRDKGVREDRCGFNVVPGFVADNARDEIGFDSEIDLQVSLVLMPDQLTSPASARSRTVLKRNASSRSSMVVNSAVSFFKQSRSGHQHHPTLVEDPGLFSDNEDDDTLFYDTVYPLTYDRELVTLCVLAAHRQTRRE